MKKSLDKNTPHGGRINVMARKPNATTRLFCVLSCQRGQWASGMALATKIKTTCLSTRVSELRHDLPRINATLGNGKKWRVEHEQRIDSGVRSQWYRLVLAK